MSELLPQSTSSYIMYEETPMIERRVFRCLDCDEYVVYPSNSPVVASTCSSIPTLDMPFFETINKSDLSHSSFPYDLNSLQSFSSDSSNLVQSAFSLSHSSNSPTFFSTDVSLIPFPQVTDSSIIHPFFDSSDTPSYQYRIETDRSDEVALLRLEVERLKDVVQTLQQSHQKDDNIPTSNVRSFTQYSENMETITCTNALREEVFNVSAQLEKATGERDNLETRLRGIEDYLPSLVSWAVETTQALDRLKEPQKIKKSYKRSTKA